MGRSEDLAGMVIVLIMALTAHFAGYEAVTRLAHPQPVAHLSVMVAAPVFGFLGNEVVALSHIEVGKEIGSVALIVDRYHARTGLMDGGASQSW